MRRIPADTCIYVVLVLVLVAFSVFVLIEVYSVDGLFSYDPYYHMHLSELMEREGDLVTEIQFYETEEAPQYVSSMRSLTALIHEYTGISYLNIYKGFGLFCRIFTALALFITAAYFLRSKKYALIAVILFLSSPYIIYRSFITFPENLVMPFHILIFYSLIKSLREKKADHILPVLIAASLYIHYRSIIVPAVLVLVFLLFWRRIRYTVGLLASMAILAAPILVSAVEQYVAYLQVNVGPSAAWKPYTVADPSYTVPTLSGYQSQLGALLLLFSLLGIPFLIRKINAQKFLLLVWLVFTFALTRGKAIGLYVPPDRMLAYLCMPAALTAAVFFKEIVGLEVLTSRARYVFVAAVTVVLIFFLFVNLPSVHGWVGVGADELNTSEWLNDNVSQDAVILPFDLDLITIGLESYKNVDGLSYGDWTEIFSHPLGVKDRLRQLYPDKRIYIVTGNKVFSLHDAEIVFSEGDMRVYTYWDEGT